MRTPRLFDIVAAAKAVEALCSDVLAQHREPLAVEAVRLFAAEPGGWDLQWRLRNMENGHYHDVEGPCVSSVTLALLSRIGTSYQMTQPKSDALMKDVGAMLRTLTDSLNAPIAEWSSPRLVS
jgi:hypothetical protein